MKYILVVIACAALTACCGTVNSAAPGSALPPSVGASPATAPSSSPSPQTPAPQSNLGAIIGPSTTLDFAGNVFQAVVTNDGNHAFVSLSAVPLSQITPSATPTTSASTPQAASTVSATPSAVTTQVGAIAVLAKSSGGWQIEGYVTLQGNATGIALFPDQSTLAVADETAGLALINVQDAIAGTAQPTYIQQGASVSKGGNGSIDVAVSNDNKFVFVANEYGQIGSATTPGNIGVVAVQEDSTGHATGTLMGNISTGQSTIPGLTLSPDGTTLYVANEASKGTTVAALTGYDNPATGFTCQLSQNTTFSGSVSVIDVAQAEAKPDASAILATVAAGCETTRIAVSPDNSTIWVTARASNLVYAFDAAQLKSDPANAFISATGSGGTEPVGIALLDGGRYAAVSNTNRAEVANPGPNGVPVQGIQNVTIFNLDNPGMPLNVQTVPSGLFPRNVSVSPDGTSLLIPNYDSNTLQIAPILR